MSEPRLCEILGVEVDKPFYFRRWPDFMWHLYKVRDDGYLLCSNGGEDGKEKWEPAGLMDLCAMIDSGLPKWTPEDRKAARCIRWLIPSADKIGWAGEVKAVLGEFENRPLLVLPPEFFPNLRPGETVRLKEILEGDEENAD